MSPQVLTLDKLPQLQVNNSTKSRVSESITKPMLQISTSVKRVMGFRSHPEQMFSSWEQTSSDRSSMHALNGPSSLLGGKMGTED